MALGDVYNNNNNSNKEKKSPVVYTDYGYGNSESNVDKTKLNVSYWNGLIKLSISPLKGVNQNGQNDWDTENAISIYLTHTKARILRDEICMFQQEPSMYSNVGVPSGTGLISISNGKELGVSGIFLIARKLNPENGSIDSSYAYEFKQDFHYSIRNFDSNTSDFDKIYHNELELEQLKTILEQYYLAMTNAFAYSVIDNSKFNNSIVNTKLNSIQEKLGIEYGNKGGYNNSNKSSTSIFNNREPRNFSQSSIDDIENQMG